MKLCYIWVEKYKNLEDFGLNLCSKVQYSYDKTTSELIECQKTQAPSKLFNEKFSEITAIVGKNSAGKSNSLDLICSIIVNNIRNFKKYIIIAEDNGYRHIYTSENKHNELINKTQCSISNDISSIKNLNVIFFSNIYDSNHLPTPFFNREKNFKFISASNNYNISNSYRDKKYSTLFRKQMSFIKNMGRKNLEIIDFDVPENIIVNISVRPIYEYVRFNSDINRDIINNIRSFDRDVSGVIREILSNNEYSGLDKYTQCLRLSIAHKAFEGYINLNKQDAEYFSEMMDTVKYHLEIGDYFEILELCESWNENFEIDPELLHSFYLVEHFEKNTSAHMEILKNNTFQPRNAAFTIKFKTTERLSSQLYEHLELMLSFELISVKWEGISSGHNAFLTLFSLIYDALKGTRANTILCIDEGDLYLHPKWQIQFFRNIEKIIPQFSNSSSQKIQLILTSHSPFLLTDLPRNNIIILNKGKVVESELKTFGANLYDLYDQAFFLDEEKIGTFAYDKIMEALENIDSSDKESRDNARSLVNIIGDDLIRNQLVGMMSND